MVDPLTAISIGSAAVGLGKRIFGGRRRRPDNRRAIAELRAAFPLGLTAEDLRSGELTRGRLSESARAEGQLAGFEVSRRQRARGLTGSPSEERAQARVGQQVALGVQRAGESSEELLSNIRLGRERARQEAELAIFGAQTGETARESARQQAEDAAFWNSLLEFAPTIIGAIPGDAGGAEGPLLGQPGFRYPRGAGFVP